jgi:hypothetical protein
MEFEKMKRLMQIAIILTISVISLVSAGFNNKVTISRSMTSPVSEIQSTVDVDNATSQSDNITKTILISGYDKTGKMIENGSNVITLSPEQLAEVGRLIEQYKKQFATDPNRIRFRSGYVITLTAGTIDTGILENGKASGNDYYIIQFYTDMADLDKETRDTLNQIGCILDPVGNHVFYAKIPPEALDTVILLVNDGKIRYLGRVPTEAKYYPELLTKAQQNPNNPIKIAIQLFNVASDSDIATLNQLMRIDWHWKDNIAGEAPAGNIKDIIALNFVRWIEEDLPMTPQNNDGTPPTTIPEEYRKYLVVLTTESAEYRNQISTINGVEHIQDAIYTGTDNEKYPAIAISANEQAAEQIKNLDFVIAASPIAGISPAPTPPPSGETSEATNMRLVVIGGIFAVLALAIVMIIYLIRRRRSQA